MRIKHFKVELSKSQIELLLALINAEYDIDKAVSLRELSRIAKIDYTGCLYRNKDWLLQKQILIENFDGFEVDFVAIADLLFAHSAFAVLYRFALRHLEYGL